MGSRARFPDCERCEAPCCRRQLMEDGSGWFPLSEIRPIYLEAGIDVRVVGWVRHADGRQPMVECTAYDKDAHRCGAYERRPAHCRAYDCRDDGWDPDWRTRAHCLLPSAPA
ncbi:MAG TPA: hypothetical protein VFM93_12835 [Candidatus Limnocylindria bacterium]|nr:hypothetical protein [Candidatus Limnocylindria bacterium]